MSKRPGQPGHKHSCSSPSPSHLLPCPSVSPSLPFGLVRPPRPASHTLSGPPNLEPSRETDLLLPIPAGPARSQSSRWLLLLLPEQSVLTCRSPPCWHRIAMCASKISWFPIPQEDFRTFCPSTGQDPTGVGNAGPNPRHQTERDRKGKYGTVLGDLGHLVTSF